LNFGTPQYLWNIESYKLPKVVRGDDGNLRAEPDLGAEPIVRGAEEGRFGALCPSPETKHLRTYQSISFAILFKNVVKYFKNQSDCYIFTNRWGIIEQRNY